MGDLAMWLVVELLKQGEDNLKEEQLVEDENHVEKKGVLETVVQ